MGAVHRAADQAHARGAEIDGIIREFEAHKALVVEHHRRVEWRNLRS